MYLKNIDVQGFKSFADKISLDFTQGITAIVGPNGSGKSNISDAIRWVMGEQSVKSLRGSKMEDVIFAGTQERKALNYAEVSLTIDNQEHELTLDYSEITITRRVYRSGESEYYINKTSCRLKDIHELFMDTGLGREGYSVIGQGKIDDILSTKSEDRRQIFEEAAGITKYKYRKNEAEKKLFQTNENLLRIKDIIIELETQLEPLKTQSEKAKKFLNLREELKILEINLSIDSIDKLKKVLSEISSEFETINSELSDVKNKLEEIDKHTESLHEIIRNCDIDMENHRNNEREVQNKIHTYNNDMNLFMSTIEHNKENINRIKGEINKITQSISGFDNSLQWNNETLENLNKKNEEITFQLSELNKNLAQLLENTENTNKELEELKTDIIEKNSEINGIKSKTNNLNVLLDNFTSRNTAIESEITEKNNDLENLNNNINSLNKNLDEKNILAETVKNEINNLDKIYGEKKFEYENLHSTKNLKINELTQKKSKKTLLEDMEKDFEGYTKSVKSVMNAYTNGTLKNIKIHGPLGQLISTDEKFALAIEIALGAISQNIVTQSEQDAKTAIEYLKKNHLGRATFLPLTSVKGRNVDTSQLKDRKGFIDVASNVIKCDDIFSEVTKNILGKTAIVDNIDNAINISKEFKYSFRIVTLSGEIIQAGGAMTGGSTGKSGGFLSRSIEIENLSKDIATLEDELKKIQPRLAGYHEELSQISQQIESSNTNLNNINQDIIKISTDLTHYSTFNKNTENSQKQLQSERTQITEQIERINFEINANSVQVTKISEEIVALERQITDKSENFTAYSLKKDELNNSIMQVNIEKNVVLKDIEMQNERIQKTNSEKAFALNEIAQKQEEIASLKDKNENMKDDIAFKKEQISQFGDEIQNSLDMIVKLTEKKQSTNEEIKEYQLTSKDTRERMYLLQQEFAKIEGKKSKSEADLENTINRMWEEYELTYSDALSYKKDDIISMSKVSKRISDIREDIKNLGNINIDAIEEYKNVKERYDFLSAQRDDLDKAKEDLQKIIDEMLDIMQKQFSEQFSIINQKFNLVFSQLFGGGKANLRLTDPGDLLSSGIEIEAQPPGKKLQSLTLLSGGERAFTAIALLFALLEVRPTPFCILDEIEAALDDVNVYRFADYLKNYCMKTQFIIVTHRRGTMEAANMLYGVTMQEQGVSKLLSLNIDEIAI